MGQDPDSIQREIAATRTDMTETAQAIVSRVDPRARARSGGRRGAAALAGAARAAAARGRPLLARLGRRVAASAREAMRRRRGEARPPRRAEASRPAGAPAVSRRADG